MCGIIGYSSPSARPTLSQALTRIAHRGPDDSGECVVHDLGVGLGHVRLSIIDLSSAGKQPMTSADGRYTIIFNGELYDYREHRKRLQLGGAQFVGDSDTEVLLRLLEVDGFEALSALNGIFAFALLDRSTGDLSIVRDALGVKPLYYALSEEGFFFCSEIKGLLALGIEPGGIDVAAIERYLTYLWCPGSGTPISGVKKLGPGEAITVHAGKVTRHWRWYELPTLKPRPTNWDEARTIKETQTHLQRSVFRQMVADVPVGAFLSGGLDSSAIVAFAREMNPDIRCYTIAGAQEEGVVDDLPYARRVAAHLKVPLSIVEIDPRTMACDLVEMVRQLDEPLADPAPLNVLYMSRLARSQGIKVLLSGTGGDDLFSGYRRHRAIQWQNIESLMPRWFRSGLEDAVYSLDHRQPLFRRLGKFTSGLALDGDERIVNYFAWASPEHLEPLYSRPFKDALDRDRAARPMLEFLAEMQRNTAALDRMLALEQRFFLADHNLTYTDKMSMAVGVEVRVPFLDLDLIKFAATVPHRFKQRGAVGKWILKKAMEPYLPREIIYRPKTGFGAPLRRWIRDDLSEMLDDLLSSESLKKRGLFEPTRVRKLISDNQTGRVDGSYTLLSLMCIELWFRNFANQISLHKSPGRPPLSAALPRD